MSLTGSSLVAIPDHGEGLGRPIDPIRLAWTNGVNFDSDKRHLANHSGAMVVIRTGVGIATNTTTTNLLGAGTVGCGRDG